MAIAITTPTTEITYGSFTFPEESLYGNTVAIEDQAININGSVDQFATQITINGIITATGLEQLNTIKNILVAGCSSQSFVNLSINNEVFNLCKTESVNFPDGDYSTFLPYSISFTSVTLGTHTKFFGVSSPEDSWDFSSNNLVGSASHTVSAIGEKVDALEPIDNAISFVNGRRNLNLDDVSTFHTANGDYILIGTNETIDRINGFYSIVDNYEFMEEGALYAPNTKTILKCNVQSEWSAEAGHTVKVDGSLNGAISGYSLATSDFTFDEARDISSGYLLTSKADAESYELSELIEGDFSYAVDEEANKIDFSFTLIEADSNDVIVKQPNDTKVLHENSVSISLSKEGGSVVSLTLNGTLTYFGDNNPITQAQQGNEETSIRWLAISDAFNGINQFALANSRYLDFKSQLGTIYSMTNQVLSQKETSTTVDKNLKEMKISYTYSYTDKFDPAVEFPNLKNVKLSITDDTPFERITVKETVAGFSEQKISNGYGTIQAKGTAEAPKSEMNNLITVTDRLFNGEGYFVRDSSKEESDPNISYSVAKYYPAPTAP